MSGTTGQRHPTKNKAPESAPDGISLTRDAPIIHASRITHNKCCAVIEETVVESRQKRYSRTKPQPWVVRKLVVLITLGIMGYAAYVYIGRFCLNMIRQTRQAAGSKSTGIALLTVFCVLYLWMLWAYMKVVITSPGYAKDYIPKSPQPLFEEPVPPVSWRTTDHETEHSFSPTDPENQTHSAFDPTRTHRPNKVSYSSSNTHAPLNSFQRSNSHHDPIAGPSYEDIVNRTSSHPQRSDPEQGGSRDEERHEAEFSLEAGEDIANSLEAGRLRSPRDPPFSALVGDVSSEGERERSRDTRSDTWNVSWAKSGQTVEMEQLRGEGTTKIPNPSPRKRKGGSLRRFIILPCTMCLGDGVEKSHSTSKKQRGDALNKKVEGLVTWRRPPTTPMLHPAHRYCHRDEIVKPYRAHHCRSCGTCVLKFDHHCPWIGQCVGARNHKFFLNFCEVAAVVTLYVLGTVVGFNAKAWSSPSSSAVLDPQDVVLMALAALFALFTTVLTVSHINLILKSQTTVENLSIGRMRERENSALRNELGWSSFELKRRARKRWNEEWGDLDTEGNIWWMGSKKQAWVDVMGQNPLGWIFPIGRGIGDGLSYPVNPRFDKQGRWRRRAEWPPELR